MTVTDSNDGDNPREPLIDFSDTIDRLERRAKRASRRVLMIGCLLVVSVLVIFSVLTVGIFERTEAAMRDFMRITKITLEARDPIENALEGRITLLLHELVGTEEKSGTFVPPTPARSMALRNQLEDSFDDLQRYRKIEEIGKTSDISDSSGISAAIESVVFSLGAVAFVVLLIQIAVSFMRYHTRLAELYEAQADALRASGGIPSRAYGFMDHFSPNAIELGKAPTMLYEKALDTVKEVAKK